jgi:hypothetical protein
VSTREQREVIRARSKALYEQRRARSLCVTCGEHLPPVDTWSAPRTGNQRKPVRCPPCKVKLMKSWELHKANGDDAKRDGVMDMSGERCRCGLRLPCNDCIPTSQQLAAARNYHCGDYAVNGGGQSKRRGGAA